MTMGLSPLSAVLRRVVLMLSRSSALAMSAREARSAASHLLAITKICMTSTRADKRWVRVEPHRTARQSRECERAEGGRSKGASARAHAREGARTRGKERGRGREGERVRTPCMRVQGVRTP